MPAKGSEMREFKVYETKDYDKFKFINGNRNINNAHLRRIVKSIQDHGYLFTIIIVNEKFEIIDGQHRYKACVELNLPIYYVVKRGYGLSHVHTYNQNSKNWTLDQFVNSYSDMGVKDYQIYRFFKEKYNFGHHESYAMLTNNTAGMCQDVATRFKMGLFKVKNLEYARQSAEKIYQFAPYYEGFRRRAFVFALLKLFKNPNYDHDQMITKIKYQSSRLTDHLRTEDYLTVLEKIYNFKTRDNKVRFDLAASR